MLVNSRYYAKVKEMECPYTAFATQRLPKNAEFDNLGIVLNTNVDLKIETTTRIVKSIINMLIDYGFMTEETTVDDVHIEVVEDDNYSFEIQTW